ncbi:MAG: MarR family transcriptional regulator [Bacteroidota bacterium]|nr:MarR family transcriptional regulator [Bacteroidota bacterium]
MLVYYRFIIFVRSMEQIEAYLQKLLGIEAKVTPLTKQELAIMPYYLTSTFKFYRLTLYSRDFILVDVQHDNFNITQTKQQLQVVKKDFNKEVALVAQNVTALERKRLIEAGINFIVPNKQVFLPDLLINLNENNKGVKQKKKTEKLLPSAQYLLLYYILHRYEKRQIEEYTFKELAKKFDYTQMAITKAVENLVSHELCETKGTKEKYLHFKYPQRSELWNEALPIMVTPVLKRVFVDEKPEGFMCLANTSALPEYSDMNPSKQKYYAVEKTIFYDLQKKELLVNENENEGNYCLEVWKYNPKKLTEGITEGSNVDPLSLYLSLKDNQDERIEMALEQIIEKYIW